MRSIPWSSKLGVRKLSTAARCGLVVLLGCFIVASFIHYPVPRVQDEFSYALLGDTLSSGELAANAPDLPEFFDSFHILIKPVHASKYFPAQGVLLAFGEKLTGHPALGIWLGAAFGCAVTTWMLSAWVSPDWATLGSILIVLTLGIFSYWSQTYWGGWVAAGGGALFFGAARRLWVRITWAASLCLGLGLVLLASTRPTEGLIAVLPMSVLLVFRFHRETYFEQRAFWTCLVAPVLLTVLPAAAAIGTYNRAITGRAWKPPYILHEEQYQESPQFSFMPLRPKIQYTSEWLRYYYEVNEMRMYMSQRTPLNLLITAAPKLTEWWQFYCGLLLSIPLVLPGLLRRDWRRYAQLAILAGFLLVGFTYEQRSVLSRLAIDALAIAQIALLWKVFEDFWCRLAIGTSVVILFESMFVKWGRPHYFAPAASLIFFLQTEGLRQIWNHTPSFEVGKDSSRAERRRKSPQNAKRSPTTASWWRVVVVLLPIACFLSLLINVLGRRFEWWDESQETGATRHVLPMHDWSLRRAELEKWLTEQPTPQLVFVRYFPTHNVNFEWVYNHADIMNSQVIWARDLGTEHNKLLLKLVPERQVWLLEADRPEPQLAPYNDGEPHLGATVKTSPTHERYIGW
jgi:hypothetical protein